MTKAEWEAKGQRLFGPNQLDWKFVCPCCGHVASIADWRAAGAEVAAAAFSCVGRWIEGSAEAFVNKGKGPCTYAGGGLFRLNPIEVMEDNGKVHEMFAFAEVQP